MTKEKDEPREADDQGNGMAVGIPFGVVLSLLVDSWAMVGVGVALGVSFRLLPSSKGTTSEDAGTSGADPEADEQRLDPGNHR